MFIPNVMSVDGEKKRVINHRKEFSTELKFSVGLVAQSV
jgi:hypothetical protein